DPREMGLITENTAASHLRALAYQEAVRCFYWRDKKDEVDLLYDHPKQPVAFEITISKKHNDKGLSAFQEKFPRFSGRCFLVSSDAKTRLPHQNTPGSIPLDLFLITLGRQMQHSLAIRVETAELRRSGQLLLF